MTTFDDIIGDVRGDEDHELVVRDLGTTRILVLNRPARRNALSIALRRTLGAELARADQDEAVRAIVLAGAGGTFCSGLDTGELTGDERISVRPHPGEAARAVRKPLIAAVDGFCVTGGLELALSCSFVIASERAQFADTHAKIGVFPSWGLTALLPRAVGVRRARQLSLTGEFIDARTASAWGLVNEVVGADDLFARTCRLAELIAVNDRSSQLDQLRLIWAMEGEPLAIALAAEERTAAERISARSRGPANA